MTSARLSPEHQLALFLPEIFGCWTEAGLDALIEYAAPRRSQYMLSDRGSMRSDISKRRDGQRKTSARIRRAASEGDYEQDTRADKHGG
jgi:hypothetical protein